MDICKLFLVKLLEGLKLEDKDVEVLTEFPPGEILPAVTMSRYGGGYQETMIHDVCTPLPEDHPYYEKFRGDLCNQDQLWVSRFKTSIILHVWSHSNDERDIIVGKIRDLLLWNRHGFSKEGSVHLRNIGGVTDVDQFEVYPVLYHSTITLEFLYELIHRKKVNPLLNVEKNEKIK